MDSRRNTVQRRLILDALRALDIHATAEQVYGYVVKQHPSISKATVYRNLGQMAGAGEILNIGSFQGSAHYDHQCHRHYHFVCEECRRVFDVEDYFPDICEKLTGLDGFEIRSHNLTFSGLCRRCKGIRKEK